MEFAVGTILEGKVTGITKFGAFVSIPAGRTGMVHISEVAHTYVNDIRDHLTEGQDVKVKVIGIDDGGRINLSIKKTAEPPAPARQDPQPRQASSFSAQKRAPATFEDRLKQFMTDSNSKMSDLKQHTEKRGAKRSRRG